MWSQHQPDERLALAVQLEQEMSGRVQPWGRQSVTSRDGETLTCTVPLLSLDDAGLAGLSGLRLDGDDHLVVILARTTLHEICIFTMIDIRQSDLLGLY